MHVHLSHKITAGNIHLVVLWKPQDHLSDEHGERTAVLHDNAPSCAAPHHNTAVQ